MDIEKKSPNSSKNNAAVTPPVGEQKHTDNTNQLLERRLSKASKIKDENQIKKDINDREDVYQYYTGQDNYQDDIPFDLYNMVELAKRVTKPYAIPKIKELGEYENNLMLRRKSRAEIDNERHFMVDPRKKISNNEIKIIENPLKYININFEDKGRYLIFIFYFNRIF